MTAYVVLYLPHCSFLVCQTLSFMFFAIVLLLFAYSFVLCRMPTFSATLSLLLNWCPLARASIERSFSIRLLFIIVFFFLRCYCYCSFLCMHKPTSDAYGEKCDIVRNCFLIIWHMRSDKHRTKKNCIPCCWCNMTKGVKW